MKFILNDINAYSINDRFSIIPIWQEILLEVGVVVVNINHKVLSEISFWVHESHKKVVSDEEWHRNGFNFEPEDGSRRPFYIVANKLIKEHSIGKIDSQSIESCNDDHH